MDSIKSFAYLDDYKMYSISSQIFEGMTEYIVRSNTQGVLNKDEQKGNLGSGRTMADLIEKQSNETEKRFLHDYSYSLFEKKLIEDKKVLVVDDFSFDESIKKLSDFNFVKVTNKVIFNDTVQIENLLGSFNKLGLALTYATNQAILTSNDSLKNEIHISKDKNQKAKLESNFKVKTNAVKELAKANGLQLNDEFLDNLKYLVNYGYRGQFEIQIPFTNKPDNIFFSSIIKREKLTESEDILVKKFGRFTQKKFTLFGILTQTEPTVMQETVSTNTENFGVKEAILNMVSHITNLENHFVGKLNREIVVDPIAIYQDILSFPQ